MAVDPTTALEHARAAGFRLGCTAALYRRRRVWRVALIATAPDGESWVVIADDPRRAVHELARQVGRQQARE